MHIVIVPSWYPGNRDDMAGMFFKEQAIALENENIDVTIAYVETRSAKKIFKDLITGVWHSGYSHTNEMLNEYRYKIYNIFMKIPYGRELLIYIKLKKIINKIENEVGKIDLIHLHSFLSHGYAVYNIKKTKNINYVIYIF